MSALIPETVDLTKYIEQRDGRPHLRGRRLSVMFVASAHQATSASVADLAYQFTLSEEQVLAALLYYHEHRAEMDAQDALDRQQSEDMHRRFSKKPGST
jgi:uncharacterized protein (DUF433 family)